jgi:hypothetical protein
MLYTFDVFDYWRLESVMVVSTLSWYHRVFHVSETSRY